MTPEDETLRIQELSNALIATINGSKGGKVGIQFDALAYTSTWFLMNVGGPHRFDEMLTRYVEAMMSFRGALCSRDVAIAAAAHDLLAKNIAAKEMN